MRATGASSPFHGSSSKVLGSGCEHVGLLHPRVALDGAAVEGHALLERRLEFGRRDGERLQEPLDVGEPEADEADTSFLDGPEHVIELRVHGAIFAV